MTDLFGVELRAGDRVAFAKKGRQVGMVATGVIRSFEPERYSTVAVIIDDVTEQRNIRAYPGEMIWLSR